MSKAGDLKPLESRILEIIEGATDWLTRVQISKELGRPGGIQPNDIAALDRLTALDLIESRTIPRGAVAIRWQYRSKQK